LPIWWFQLSSYLPAHGKPHPLPLHLALLPLRILSQHIPEPIFVSLHSRSSVILSFRSCMLRFGSQAQQCTKGSGSF
jgi:hypothetical protein